MEFKHTPAPWQLAGGNNENYEINCGDTTIDLTRCEKNTGKHVISREEMEANAKLIAKAPEMLEALNLVQDKWIKETLEWHDIAKIIQLITEATTPQ